MMDFITILFWLSLSFMVMAIACFVIWMAEMNDFFLRSSGIFCWLVFITAIAGVFIGVIKLFYAIMEQ